MKELESFKCSLVHGSTHVAEEFNLDGILPRECVEKLLRPQVPLETSSIVAEPI